MTAQRGHFERPASAPHGPDDDCPQCYECPGCGGGDGSTPRNPVLDRSRPGVVLLTCGDCNSSGYLCPNFVKEAGA